MTDDSTLPGATLIAPERPEDAAFGSDAQPASQPVAAPAVAAAGDAVEDGFSEEPPLLDADRAHPLFAPVREALRTVYDPEIPVNIYELGLIYRLIFAEDGAVTVDMTLTAPGCPVAGEMPGWVDEAVRAVPGVSAVAVNLIWDPLWDPSKMSDIAKVELGFF